ncbi:MAG: hypothetical protein ACYDEH_09850 [Acidimicrobiales bacterium]
MDNAIADIKNSPLPTAQTLRRRNHVLYQLWRFVALNVRFVTMIFKGDH